MESMRKFLLRTMLFKALDSISLDYLIINSSILNKQYHKKIIIRLHNVNKTQI
jgi:hypothetical protein